jgi:Copper type II ascorbate-dependent monooxygenase, C-terminal domain
MIPVDKATPARRPATAAAIVVLAMWSCCGFPAPSKAQSPASSVPSPTYSREIAPILRARCRECHRVGQVGPFALDTYDQARKRARDLASVVQERRMPPWKPSAGVGPKLKHDPSLSPSEIALIRAWADAGAPRGLDSNLPREIAFQDGWKLGEPDLVIEPEVDFPVPAMGVDLYRCFVIPTRLPNDVYVSAVEYRPGNPRVVHHLMAFIEIAGAGRKRDEAEPGPGYESYSGAGVDIFGDLGGWAPGNEPAHLPEGIGRSLPRGADVILQVHYHPNGKSEVDRTKIGLYFSKKPVRQTLQWKGVMTQKISLEPGNPDTRVKASWMVPVDVEALAVAPHMHQLGREMKMTASLPGGRTIDLIQVLDWDPGWQSTYAFEKPVSLPKGTVVKVVAHYDNSTHARNPNQPPKRVKWGPGSTDEMCVGYIAVVKSRQDLTKPGEKDDLFAIFVDQYERIMRREQNALKRW